MKAKAIVILVCFLAYIAGWMYVPLMMSRPDKSCCSKTTEPKKDHHCPKDEKGSGGRLDCGISCPMCFTMIMPAADLGEIGVEVAVRSYSDFHSTYQYRFHPDAWKPPNKVMAIISES